MRTNVPTATDSPANGSSSTTNSSKGKKPTFGIVLDSPVVASGATLAGRVWADIPHVLTGTRMHVDFVGREKTKVVYQADERRRAAYSKRDIFRIALPVSEQLNFTPTGQIEPGQYVIPFSAVLPAFLPSNMKIEANQGYAKITYKVKMVLKGSGVGRKDILAIITKMITIGDYTAEAPVTIISSSIGMSFVVFHLR